MDITMSCTRLQEVCEVLKHLADRRSYSPASDKVLVRSEPGKIALLATNGDVDLIYYDALPESPGTASPFLLPVTKLMELAKGADGPVTLSGESEAPAAMEKYPTFDTAEPKRHHYVDWPKLRAHLRNAGMVTASGRDRYALNHICLSPESVVATDGRQLYAGNSLALPLRKDQEWLIPPSKVFLSRTLSNYAKVALAREENGILFRFGENWIVRLRRQEGAFPDWKSVVPPLDEAEATLVIPETVAAQTAECVRQLLGGCDADTRLSLSLGPKTVLASVDKDGRPIRSQKIIDLTRSGEEMTVLFDSKYFLSALKLGFLTLHFFAPNRPIIATRNTDMYLWMPCVEETAAANPAAASQPSPTVPVTPTPKEESMPENKIETPKVQPQSNDLDSILTELDSIKDGLHSLLGKIGTVKQAIRQRSADLVKREKTLQQALASLKQLKDLAA